MSDPANSHINQYANPSTLIRISIWIPTFTGTISVIASSLIVYIMISDREYKLKKPSNRFLLIMSIIDILQSLAYAFGTLPLPVSSGSYNAYGNDLTCSIQGFFIHLGIAVPCYNASLCIWYLMAVKYNMDDEVFRKKIEPYCHVISILLPLGPAIALLCLNMLAPRGFLCWIGQDKTSYSELFVLCSAAIPVAICFIIIVFCLISIYKEFKRKEETMRRYSTSPSGVQWRANAVLKSKQLAAKQGLLFSSAFAITFFFTSINVLFFDTNDANISPFTLPQSIFMPLQGFWNFIIFARPTMERIQEEYPELSFITGLRKMILTPYEVRSRPIPRGERRGSLTTRRFSYGGEIP
jgi:hypothetical protein